MITRRKMISDVFAAISVPLIGKAYPVRSMIAAEGSRMLFEEGGGEISAASYIHDGLVVMWDAIENSGHLSHNDNATTWVDLSGNGYDAQMTGTLGSGYYWEDNAYVRMNNGVGGGFGYVDITDLMLNPVQEAKFTVEMVTRSPTYSSDWTTQIFNLCTASNSGWSSAIVSVVRREDDGRVYPTAFSTYRCNQNFYPQNANQIMTVSSVLDGSYYSFYHDSILANNTRTNITPDGSISGVFARLGSTGYAFRGRYMNYRIYSRPLSKEELEYNSSIDKIRFLF